MFCSFLDCVSFIFNCYTIYYISRIFKGFILNAVCTVSADMAHGVHPNFMDKHEEHHRPELQKGLVIKHNANQRYATSGITAFLFKEVGRIHNLPTQVLSIFNVVVGKMRGKIIIYFFFFHFLFFFFFTFTCYLFSLFLLVGDNSMVSQPFISIKDSKSFSRGCRFLKLGALKSQGMGKGILFLG